MRASLVVILLVWVGLHGLAAQPILPLDAQRAHAGPDWPRLEMRRGGAEASSDGGYGRSFGGALLGATIGGGLGALIGPVAEEELYPECSRRTRDCEGDVYLAPFGVWFGSVIGALAGAQADIDGSATVTAVVGSGFGSLIGLAALATASNGRYPWGAGGFVLGAASGAAFGATIAAPDSSPRAVLSRDKSGTTRWRWPRPILGPNRTGGVTVHVPVVRIRF